MKNSQLLLIFLGSLCFLGSCGSGSSPATHFSLSVPASATAGIAFNFTVTALDASNKVVTDYSGTVHFTSTDGHAALPLNTNLTGGTATVPATLNTAGAQTMTATDSATASITGSSGSIAVSAGPASHLSVNAPATATSGAVFNFTVTALDSWNNTATSYSGVVQFASTDGQAVLPANSTVATGSASFSATLKTVGSQSITAIDTTTVSVRGTSGAINVMAPVLAITSGALPKGTVGVQYFIHCSEPAPCDPTVGFVLTASGGVAPYSWSWTSAPGSSVPPGLSLASKGLITGIPATAGTYNVIVTVSDSETPAAENSANYTILIVPPPPSNAVPLIRQQTKPDAVAPGGSAFTLTVNGSGFAQGATVQWNGSPRATTYINHSTLTAAILASDIATANTASLTVVNPSPGGGTSNVSYFQVTNSTSWAGLISPSVLTEDAGVVAVGDFNGDGKLDLAVTASNAVSIYFGNGGGTFRPAVNSTVPENVGTIVAADFNGDGRLDLAVGGNNVHILLGNGDGTFQPAVQYGPGSAPTAMAAADFNADGKLDLAITSSTGNNVIVLLGNGDGTFQSGVDFAVGSNPVSVTVGDFNGDGALDLAVANNLSDTISILLGNGDGTFETAANFATGIAPSSVAAADFNGDNTLDLAVANSGGNTISILLGNGDGNFQPASEYSSGNNPGAMAVGDFNGDNKLDVAVTNGGTTDVPLSGISLLLGNGDGTFQPAANYASEDTNSMVVGDFNGDGRVDLAIGDANNQIAVMLQPEVTAGPNATFSPTHLGFACVVLTGLGCRCTAEQHGMVSNFGTTSLNVNSVTITGPYTSGDTCTTALEPGQSCVFSVHWSQASGHGIISFFDNADGSPQTVPLNGNAQCGPDAAGSVQRDPNAASCTRK